MELFPFKNIDEYSIKLSNPDPEIHEVKSTSDIIGLSDCCLALKKWFYSTDNILLLIGPTGCGKTSLVNLFCNENEILLYDTKPKKDLLNDINSFLDINNFFSSKKDKLVLLDDYSTGQANLLSLVEINSLSCKLLIISADSKGSKLGDFKKINEVYFIGEIDLLLIEVWIIKFIDSINLIIPRESLQKLIHKCKSDKRLLLNTILFLKQSRNGNIDTFINTFYKNTDINVQTFIDKLFDSKKIISLNEIYKVYETDGYLLSNIVHENYIDYSDSIDNIAKSAEYISFGETVFSDTYESTKTFVPQTHCTNSLFLPSYYSRSDKTLQIRSPVISNRFNIYLNNKKIIDKINHGLTNILDITDILFIKKFLNQSLIKSKVLTSEQLDYLKNIMALFPDNQIDRMELIYKHFSNFKEIAKESKTKNFTIKFKEKLIRLK